MKLVKRIAAVLIILAVVVVGIRVAWTLSNGIDNAKDFFYDFIGQENPDIPQNAAYNNENGNITRRDLIPTRGVKSLTLDINAAIVRLRVGKVSDIVVDATYAERSVFAENILDVGANDGAAVVKFSQKKFGFFGGKRNSRNEISVTIPEKFAAELILKMNACTFDGDMGALSPIDVDVNAGTMNLRDIGGPLNAVMNACDATFTVAQPRGNISARANAGSLTFILPQRSNFRVTNSVTVGNVSNNYDNVVERVGKEFALNISGNAVQATVRVR